MLDREEGGLQDGGAEQEMEDALTQIEYAELARLVDADLNGGDVEYLAFSSLCPTMREGEFDEGACAVFKRLRDAGMIEGEFDGRAFYFTGLTSKGREFVVRRERDAEGIFGAEWAQLAGASEEVGEESVEQTADACEQPANPLLGFEGKKSLAVAIAVCAVVGFAAGIIGGVLGAYLVAI